MQRVAVCQLKHFVPMRLYREDIEDIYTVLKKYYRTVQLKIKGYVLETPDDIDQLPQAYSHATDFEFVAGEPLNKDSENFCNAVSISNTFHSVSVWITDNTDPVQNMIITELSQIFRKRSNWRMALGSSFISSIISGGILGLPLGVLPFWNWRTAPLIGILIACTAVVFDVIFFLSVVRYSSTSGLFFSYRKTQAGFLQRNKEDLAKDAIKILLGGLIALFGQWLIKKW